MYDFKKKPRNTDPVWSFFAAGHSSDKQTDKHTDELMVGLTSTRGGGIKSATQNLNAILYRVFY
jgi:hypothetical protein